MSLVCRFPGCTLQRHQLCDTNLPEVELVGELCKVCHLKRAYHKRKLSSEIPLSSRCKIPHCTLVRHQLCDTPKNLVELKHGVCNICHMAQAYHKRMGVFSGGEACTFPGCKSDASLHLTCHRSQAQVRLFYQLCVDCHRTKAEHAPDLLASLLPSSLFINNVFIHQQPPPPPYQEPPEQEKHD